MSVSAAGDDVRRALEELLHAHAAAGSPLPDCLRPTLSDEEEAAVETAFGFPLGGDLLTLYRAADGVDRTRWDAVAVVPAQLAPGFGELVPAREVLDIRTATERTASTRHVTLPGERAPDEIWRPYWWPAFPVGADEHLVVDRADAIGTVRLVSWAAGEDRVVHRSIADHLRSAARTFRALSCRWDADAGWFDYDEDRADEISRFL